MDKVFEEQLNQFILNKAIIPKSLGLWERYFKKNVSRLARYET